ncbi:MAG TPA: mechanosensitive ion channel [Bacteroidaceae bacterium]|nr:mechanosensitive ion channel [Bacteroidaceae bacterium]
MIEELINDFISKYNDGSWLSAIIISVAIIAISLAIYFLFFRILKRIYKRSNKPFLKEIGKKFKTPGLWLVMIVALNIIIFSFAPENQFVTMIIHILKLLLIFAVTWILIRFINLGREAVLMRFDIEEKDNLKARRVYTQFRIIERIIIFIVVLIAIAIALMTFERIRNIGVSLFASAGVAGIILGFAAQKMLGNILAGFQIALAQPIRIDDVVIVEDEWGWIEEITLTYVVVRIWDKRRLILPSTYFIEKPFQNWTRVSADILGTVYLYTDYTVPLDALRQELTRILESDKNWDGRVNTLQVTNSTERSMEVRALMSATDSPSAWNLRVNVREKMIDFLQKNFPESLPRSRVEFAKKAETDDIS